MPFVSVLVLCQAAGIVLTAWIHLSPRLGLLIGLAAAAALAAAAVAWGWRLSRWLVAALVLLAQAAALPFQEARALGDLGPWVGVANTVLRGRVAWVEAKGEELQAVVRIEEVLPPQGVAPLAEAQGATAPRAAVPNGGRFLPAAGTVLVSWTPRCSAGPAPPSVFPGHLVEVRGRLELPGPPGNPGEFNYRAYLAARGVRYLLRAWGDGPRPLGPAPGAAAVRLVGSARARVEGPLQALSPARAALLRGLLLGGSQGLDPDLVDSFGRAGLIHLLSASGLHVGFVLAAVSVPLGCLRLTRRAAALLALPAVGFYALLTGARAPVVRSALMLGSAVVGASLGRGRHSLGALAVAAGAILVHNPFALWDAGFQLSFAATFGLVTLAPRFRRGLARLPRPLASALSVTCAAQAATLPLALYHFGRLSLLAPVANLAAVPLAAAAVVVGFIGAAVSLVWPAGASLAYRLAGPALAVLDLWGRAVGGLPGASLEAPRPSPVALAGWSGALLLLLGAAGARSTGTGPVPGGWGPGGWGGEGRVPAGRSRDGEAGCRLCGREGAGRPGPAPPGPVRPPLAALGRRLAAALLCLACACVWDRALYRPLNVLTCYFLDVGNGDAVFALLPGGRTLLLDGGPWSGGGPEGDGAAPPGRRRSPPLPPPRAVAFLRRLGVRRLDYLILSHPHQDHLGGVVAAAEGLRVGAFYCSPQALAQAAAAGGAGPSGPAGGGLLGRLWDALERKGVPRHALARGHTLDLGGGAVLEVLHPAPAGLPGAGAGGVPGPSAGPGGEDAATNEESLVVRLRLGRVSLLLAGDLGPDGERELLGAVGTERLGCSVLKVAHHGSSTSTGEEFLAAACPQVAVISVGTGRGLPSPRLLQRLSAARVYRTDRDGAVILRTDGRGWRVKPFRGGEPARAPGG
ncbi:MAG: ComEC/Rec2 family competence protein [Acetobacteraceae bacterium]|nr:ComEC/Rec2 family competence protein [Acetobacteraceae bacterium]